MNTKLLGVSLSVIFAVSMIGAVYAAGHDVLTGITVSTEPGTKTVTFTAAAPIPTDGTGGNFGFAAFAEKGVVVTTSHPIATDSEGQTPHDVNAFHSHLVQLDLTDECVSGLAVGSLTFNEIGHTTVSGNTVTVTNVPPGLTGDISDAGTGFTLSVENDRVCVNPTA